MNQVKMVLIFAILLFLFCVNVSAQVIKGRVTDSTTNEALSYAAVEIRSFEDDVYIGGSSTNEKGEFEFHLKGIPKFVSQFLSWDIRQYKKYMPPLRSTVTSNSRCRRTRRP